MSAYAFWPTPFMNIVCAVARKQARTCVCVPKNKSFLYSCEESSCVTCTSRLSEGLCSSCCLPFCQCLSFCQCLPCWHRLTMCQSRWKQITTTSIIILIIWRRLCFHALGQFLWVVFFWDFDLQEKVNFLQDCRMSFDWSFVPSPIFVDFYLIYLFAHIAVHPSTWLDLTQPTLRKAKFIFSETFSCSSLISLMVSFYPL